VVSNDACFTVPLNLITAFSLEAPPHPKQYNFCWKSFVLLLTATWRTNMSTEHWWFNSDNGKTAVLGQKPVPMSLYAQQTTRGISKVRTRAAVKKLCSFIYLKIQFLSNNKQFPLQRTTGWCCIGKWTSKGSTTHTYSSKPSYKYFTT